MGTTERHVSTTDEAPFAEASSNRRRRLLARGPLGLHWRKLNAQAYVPSPGMPPAATLAKDVAGGDVECRTERRRAVTSVVEGAPRAGARCQVPGASATSD